MSPILVATYTRLSVIGALLASNTFDGVNLLCSIMQMPSGVLVEMVRIFNARNAVMLVSEITVLSDGEVAKTIVDYHE